MDLHMREFDNTTFGMSVNASDPAFRRMKRNIFKRKVTMGGGYFEKTVRCVRAADVAAVMGEAGWLVSDLRCMKTIQWGNNPEEFHIIYDEGGET